MKLALFGYGKMGKLIASVAEQRGHSIVCIVDPMQGLGVDIAKLAQADVAIEFTRPDAAAANIRLALQNNLPIVSGTTGWDVSALQAQWQGKEHAGVLWSSNFSIGVNILFALNKYMAQLLQGVGGYEPSITETHHIHKVDAPSGTAVSLREGIASVLSDTPNTAIPIHSVREGEVPGIHEIIWDSAEDTLTLKHSAKSRNGFALGAVMAAEWLQGKRGWHTINELFKWT